MIKKKSCSEYRLETEYEREKYFGKIFSGETIEKHSGEIIKEVIVEDCSGYMTV